MAGEIIDEKLEGFTYDGYECDYEGYNLTEEEFEELDIETKIKIEKALEKADITDDYIFSNLMRFNDICKEVLELLLGFEVGTIIYISYQEVFNVDFKSRGIRLDILVRNKNQIFNVEMQVANNIDLAKRIRLYQSIIDASETKSGVKYEDLKPTYIIFICKEDPIGDGEYGYIAEMSVRKMGDDISKSKTFDNGATVLIYNASSKKRPNNVKLTAFLDLIDGKKSTNEFTDRIQERVYKIKLNRELRLGYMKTYLRDQDIANINIQKGIEQGKEKEKLETIYTMLEDFSDAQISKVARLPIEKIAQIRDEYLYH